MDWIQLVLDVTTELDALALRARLARADPHEPGVPEASEMLAMTIAGWRVSARRERESLSRGGHDGP